MKYIPIHEIFALCSCCPCCCHDLQILKHYDRKDLGVRSEYAGFTDPLKYINCGTCVDRYAFEALVYKDEKMEYTSDNYLGCGLCATIRPVEANSMQRLTP